MTRISFSIFSNSEATWFGNGWSESFIHPGFQDTALVVFCCRCNEIIATRIPENVKVWQHHSIQCIRCLNTYAFCLDELRILNDEMDLVKGFCPEELYRVQFLYNLELHEKANWS